MKQADHLLVLQNNLSQLKEALAWLKRSQEQCTQIGLKPNYTPDEFDLFEALTSRFARSSDILLQKVYRSIDAVELEFGGTLLDAVNRAEKRGLIDDTDQIRKIRDLRNSIAHKYLSENLIEIFQETLQLAPRLIDFIERTQTYCQNLLKN